MSDPHDEDDSPDYWAAWYRDHLRDMGIEPDDFSGGTPTPKTRI